MTENKEGRRLLEYLHLENGMEEDERKRVFLNPVRIVWESSLKNSSVEGSDTLLEQKTKQIALHVDKTCTLENRGDIASILLDFGREIHGGAELSVFCVEGAVDAVLRVRFGESAAEAMSELGGKTNATNDHARRDFQVTVRSLSMNPLGETGFRFLRIDLLTPNARVAFHTVKAFLIYRDIPYLGSFQCSDELLNRIWNVGAYTVHLNMQHYIWDGIKRDRLVWIGDLHPELATIQTVFGDQELIRKTLDFAVQQTPDGEWMNGIPSYSMWWIIIQYDYFMQFGNRAYLEKQLPYLRQLCQMLSEKIGKEGNDITPEPRFVDWPTQGSKDAIDTGLQALHVWAVECAQKIFALFQDTVFEELCRRDYEKLSRWNVCMVDAKQANALAALTGLLDAEEVNQKSLQPGGASGLSAFMGYYILLARAKAGDVSGALDVIREYWGGMLQLGATTFWEDFDIAWMKNAAPIDRLPQENEIDVHGTYGKYCYQGFRHSLCHGWASGPTSWLTKYVLGIEIIEPGCTRIRIKADLCDLKWIKGAYPTPFGVVKVEHLREENGTVRTVVQAPKEVEIVYE